MLPFQDLLRNLGAELLCHFYIHMGILKKHGQNTVARAGLELEVGGSFRGGIGTKSVAHIMRAAICDVSLTTRASFFSFFDVGDFILEMDVFSFQLRISPCLAPVVRARRIIQ